MWSSTGRRISGSGQHILSHERKEEKPPRALPVGEDQVVIAIGGLGLTSLNAIASDGRIDCTRIPRIAIQTVSDIMLDLAGVGATRSGLLRLTGQQTCVHKLLRAILRCCAVVLRSRLKDLKHCLSGCGLRRRSETSKPESFLWTDSNRVPVYIAFVRAQDPSSATLQYALVA